MKNIFFALGTIIVLALLWPHLPFHQTYTVTVTGTSQGQVANQIATFGATVTVENADKNTAVNSVNTKMAALIKSVKDFGIDEKDIVTNQVNVYQMPVVVPQAQPAIYPVPPVPSGNGDWQASNSISITLRDVSKASALSDLLNNSGATNIYGPNLTVDPNNSSDQELLSQAIADAKSKAEVIAKAGGQKVGRIVNVQEDASAYPIPLYASTKDSASSGSPVEPGTSTLSKSVTVTWELN